MTKKRGGIVFLILVLLGAGWFFFLRPTPMERLEKVRIGVFPDSISGLIYIAQDRGFFKHHGLDLTIASYQTGLSAVNDLMSGKVDMATAAEFVLTLKGFKTKDLRTIGTIATTDSGEIVVRKDHAIDKPEDLRGKTIGVPKKTLAEFFLTSFLSFNGLFPGETHIVDLPPSEMVPALSNGRGDAVCFFHPFTDAVKKALPGKTLSWSAQGGQDLYLLLITNTRWIKARPKAMRGFLQGVLDAEAFLKNHRSKAQDIVRQALHLDREVIGNSWAQTRFHVRLDQSLLTLMEEEARWAMVNKLVDSRKMPNYFNFLSLEELMKLKPEAVGVIH
jgi:sulfonate transport system substrate-binding protein